MSPVARAVVVVGGGPAGASAAITLARSGRRVILVDKATFPRDKFCGDGLTTSALRELEALGLDPRSVDSWQPVRTMVIRGPEGQVANYRLPDDAGLFAAVARRMDLDAAMFELARSAGAEIIEGVAVTGVRQYDDGVTVTLDDGRELDAAYVVAADGMWSPVRKLLGLDEANYRGEWHAFRQYVRNVEGLEPEELVVFFEPDFLPGYFWCFPLPDGRANIGFGIALGKTLTARDMKRMWPDLLERPHVKALLGPNVEPEAPHRAWPIPASIDRATSGDGRVLFVGDAVRACDTMSGEGIGQALISGRLAAERLEADWHRPEAVQAGYRHDLDQHFVADHRMSVALSRMLSTTAGYRLFERTTRSKWARRNFVRWLWEDYPRAILFTPRRWGRGAFGGTGAYRPTSAATSRDLSLRKE